MEKHSGSYIWMNKKDVIKCCVNTIAFIMLYRWMEDYSNARFVAEHFYGLGPFKRRWKYWCSKIENKKHALILYENHFDDYPIPSFASQLDIAKRLKSMCKVDPDTEKIFVGDEYRDVLHKSATPFKMKTSKVWFVHECPECGHRIWAKRRKNYCFKCIPNGLKEMKNVGKGDDSGTTEVAKTEGD